MADLLKQKLGIIPNMIYGKTGEFSVLVNEKVVAQKGFFGFPKDEDVLKHVRTALNQANQEAGS